MKYITICREDRQEDGTPGSYVLATRQVFDTLEEAQRHIEPISASREPLVIPGDFANLRFAKTGPFRTGRGAVSYDYIGRRREDGTVDVSFWESSDGIDWQDRASWGETMTTLDPRNDLHNHSPDGCEWGYAGSGPAQLALGLLAHHFGNMPSEMLIGQVGGGTPDENALKLYQQFKFKVVANLDSQWWVLTSKEIHEVVREIVAENEVKYPESFGSPPEPV